MKYYFPHFSLKIYSAYYQDYPFLEILIQNPICTIKFITDVIIKWQLNMGKFNVTLLLINVNAS